MFSNRSGYSLLLPPWGTLSPTPLVKELVLWKPYVLGMKGTSCVFPEGCLLGALEVAHSVPSVNAGVVKTTAIRQRTK